MKPKLVRDLLLPDYGDWPAEAIGDPFHPIHGPLPELAQIWRSGEYEYKAAIWSADDLYTMVELIMEETDSQAPLLPIAVIHAVRGWVPQTYRWRVDNRSVSCFDVQVPFPTIRDESRYRRQLFETVLRESVRFAVERRG